MVSDSDGDSDGCEVVDAPAAHATAKGGRAAKAKAASQVAKVSDYNSEVTVVGWGACLP